MSPPPSDDSVALVAAVPGDAEAIAEMAARIWPAAYGSILSPEQIAYMLAQMYAPGRLRRDFAEGVAFLWILHRGERSGYLALGPIASDGVCPLHKCYLLPERQGQGVGSVALGLLRERLSALGARSIELRVNRRNAAAIAFYRKNGFAIHAEDCRPIGSGYAMDDYLMRCELAP